MAEPWALDVAIAPDAARARIAANINRRRKRALGIFKTENEFVGFVGENGFEIWERQQRAVHARGRVLARRGGTRLEVRSAVPTFTRILIGAFFALYVVVSVGIALRPPDPSFSLDELAVSLTGALALAVIFAIAARRQRADLRTFVEGLFRDVPRI